jgi:RNA polymerase sigma-70 factor (ECF subfamily)
VTSAHPSGTSRAEPSRDDLAAVLREATGVVVASLVHAFGDLDLAEEVFQEAALAAAETWPRDGLPRSPGAWLNRVAQRKALDRLRHERMKSRREPEIAAEEDRRRAEAACAERADDDAVPDERLRLLFTCCHPTLAEDARIALTLRTLGGLTADEVASAFLVPEATMAKRLVRAKSKIRGARIPYRVPTAADLPERLDSVLAVLYLIFNQGWSRAETAASSGLCAEAIRLARIVVALLPGAAEAEGLLSLLLLHQARRAARVVDGVWVPLEQQDPSRYDWRDARAGLAVLRAALARDTLGPYQIQAAISALHLESTTGKPRWDEIAGLYATLESIAPSDVVVLNRSVAVARAEGPAAGLRLLDALAHGGAGRLDAYQPYHAARADLLRRLERRAEAADAYRRALALTAGEPERRYLAERLAEIG